LTLRVVGGMTTEEIAKAFLVPVPTVQARITRAKKTLAAAHIPFAVPDAHEIPGAAWVSAAGGLPGFH
jgi:predicted RNA polymerase sigma factor